jgi:hypothetical protein
MPIPLPLEYVIEQVRGGDGELEQIALRELGGLRLSRQEAMDVWDRIEDHKWYLSERLGRDVGHRVAVVDFCGNVEPWLRQRSNDRDWRVQLKRFARTYLFPEPVRPEYSLQAFEQAMRGTRGLAR